jgi:hypothetical protein
MTVEGRVEPGSMLAGHRVVELAGTAGPARSTGPTAAGWIALWL